MSVREVPSDHDFFDPAYVRKWSDSILRYRPERQQLFEAFSAEAKRIQKAGLSVFELGCGPGFLAEALLKRCTITRYTLLDFSPHMLELSRKRLALFEGQTDFIQRDFKQENWTEVLSTQFDLIVSLQAVHELRHASRIPKLYAQLYDLLVRDGSLLVCDQVNSPLPSHHRADHFMTVEEHLSSLKQVGFARVREICAAADLSLMAAAKD